MQLIKQFGKQLAFVVLMSSSMFFSSSASAVKTPILINTDLIIDAAELQTRFPGVNELDLVTIGGTHYSDPTGRNGLIEAGGEGILFDPFDRLYSKGNNLIVGGSRFTSNVQSNGTLIPSFTITGEFNEVQSPSKPNNGILTFGLTSSAANPPALSFGQITNYGSCLFTKCVVFHYGYKIDIDTYEKINPYFKGSFYRVRNVKSLSDLFRTYEMISPEVALNSPAQENAPTRFLVVYSQQINPKRPNAAIVNWTEFPVKLGQIPTFSFTNSQSNFDTITIPKKPRYFWSNTEIPLDQLTAAGLPPTDSRFVDIDIPGANANGIITVAPGGTTTPVNLNLLLPTDPGGNISGLTSINGAGASTVNAFLTGLKTVTPGFSFTYAPVGSGAGLTALFTQTQVAGTTPKITFPVNFAGSDDPVAETENRTNRGYIQVPVIGVGITLAYNPTGLTVPAGGIKLSRASYCGILSGSITNWSDKSISTDNGRQIALNVPIKVVHRSDSSGATFVLSSHLNTACQTAATPGLRGSGVWNRGVGLTSYTDDEPDICPIPKPLFPRPPKPPVCWPKYFIGATGGGGVASAIASTKGAIGYVDNATRVKNSLPAAVLANKSGKYIAASPASITDALLDGKVVNYVTNSASKLIRIDNLTDPVRPNAYPISTASYLVFYSDATTGIKTLINFAFGTAGDALAASLGYAPLPATIRTASKGVL